MNVLLINGSHPDIAHVSGVRAWQFANGLAALGHHVVLLCPTLDGMPETPDPAAALADHDWRAPFVLAIDGGRPPRAPRWRAIGRLVTAVEMIRHGGARGAWSKRAERALLALRPQFRPEAIWATFGHLENLLLAKSFSRSFAAPWIADVKDNAEFYVPAPLRRIMAWRVGGSDRVHCNSRLQGEIVRGWLKRDAELIYSGVDTVFFADSFPPLPAPTPRLALAGSLYKGDRLEAFLEGVAVHNRRSPEKAFDLLYLGSDAATLRSAAAMHGDAIRVETAGYVSAVEMAGLCRGSAATVSLTLDRNFHHKLLEFFACNRPVIAFGGELPESIDLATQCGARLHLPMTCEELATLLGEIAANADPNGVPEAGSTFFTWPEQTALLERSIKEMARNAG